MRRHWVRQSWLRRRGAPLAALLVAAASWVPGCGGPAFTSDETGGKSGADGEGGADTNRGGTSNAGRGGQGGGTRTGGAPNTTGGTETTEGGAVGEVLKGIDENTAIIVRQDEFEVIGHSYVAIYDNQRQIPPVGRFYFLAAGDRYNLATREASRPSQTMQPVPRVQKSKWPR